MRVEEVSYIKISQFLVWPAMRLFKMGSWIAVEVNMISRPGSYIAVLVLTIAAAPVAIAQSGGSSRETASAAGANVSNTDRKGDTATGAKRSSRATSAQPVASPPDRVRRGGITVLRDPVPFGVAASTPRRAAPSSSPAALAAQSGVTAAASGGVVTPTGTSGALIGIPPLEQGR